MDLKTLYFALIDSFIPEAAKHTREEIIKLNRGHLKGSIEELSDCSKLLTEDQLAEYMEKPAQWKVIEEGNTERIRVLRHLVQYRREEHIEMLDCEEARKIVTVEGLKKIMEKSYFENLTTHEKAVNRLMQVQGYYLKCFTVFHLRKDLVFKTYIDPMNIDLDNPYTRQMIRKDNTKNAYLKEKYFDKLEVEEFCLDLVEKFYSSIVGIWADHNHLLPAYILEFIRLCFDYGFISPMSARDLLVRLQKATVCLNKLEEGWVDKLSETERLSEMFKSSLICEIFANCRENMAQILIHILVLVSDESFLKIFPEFLNLKDQEMSAKTRTSDKEAEDEYEKATKELFEKDFCFFDKEINDAVLYITMNYLSNTVYLGVAKSQSQESQLAIEKIFLYITSEANDLYLRSLNQVKAQDFTYANLRAKEKAKAKEEGKQNTESEISLEAKRLASALSELLKMIARPAFGYCSGKLLDPSFDPKAPILDDQPNPDHPDKAFDDNKNFTPEERQAIFNPAIDGFIPQKSILIQVIIRRLLNSISYVIKNEEFRVVAVKESIPQLLMSLAYYIGMFFSTEPVYGWNKLTKEIFEQLLVLSRRNHYCLGQIFKAQSVKYLRKMLKSKKIEVLYFLNALCDEDSITFFIGNGILGKFLEIYEESLKQIRSSISSIASFQTFEQKVLLPELPSKSKGLKEASPKVVQNPLFNSMQLIDEKQPQGEGSFEDDEVVEPAKDNIPKFSIWESLGFFLMTKTIAKIFSKPFLNEHNRLQNALEVQRIMSHQLSDYYLSLMLSQINELRQEYERLNYSGPIKEYTLHKSWFENNSELTLIEHFQENEESITALDKRILILNIAFEVFSTFNSVVSKGSSRLIMNKFTKGTVDELSLKTHVQSYSLKSAHTNQPYASVYDPLHFHPGLYELSGFTNFIPKIRDYLFRTKIHSQVFSKIEPGGFEAEMLTFLRIFGAFPNQNCFMEVNVDLKALNFEYDLAHHGTGLHLRLDLAKEALDKVANYTVLKGGSALEEAKEYMFSGLFPFLFTLASSMKNLINFDKPSSVDTCIKLSMNLQNAVRSNIRYFNFIMGKEIVAEEPVAQEKISSRNLEKKDSLISGKTAKKLEDKKEKNVEQTKSRPNVLCGVCDQILTIIEQYYIVSDIRYQELYNQMKEISHAQFQHLFTGIDKVEELSSADVKTKKAILLDIIKLYSTAKESYYNRAQEPNLISYFDRNTQNLIGAFNLCIYKVLGLSKRQREKVTRNYRITEDPGIAMIWTNQSSYAYIDMLQKLLMKSKTARSEFYMFMNEDRALRDLGNKATGVSVYEKEMANKMLSKLLKRARDRYRSDFLGVLVRIQCDLVVYLNGDSNTRVQWWVAHETYTMICQFLKSLCECNFIQFKEFLGPMEPNAKDQGWTKMMRNQRGKPIGVMEILLDQLWLIFSTSRISKNKEPYMVHTDLIERILPLSVPLLNLINELITGPCAPNQSIMKQKDESIEAIANTAMRIVDKMDSDFNHLSIACLNTILSLSEGYDGSVLTALSKKIPTSVLENRLTRFTKKIYVKELIESYKFESKALKKLEQDAERERLSTIKMSREYNSENKESGTNSQNDTKALQTKIRTLNKGKRNIELALALQDIEYGKFQISEEMEAMVEIEDWEDLHEMYMKRAGVSESAIFGAIFKIISLWQMLAAFSRMHLVRLNEVKGDAALFFSSNNLFSSINIFDEEDLANDENAERRKKLKPSEFLCVFYFLTNKVMLTIEIVDPQDNPILIYFPKSPPCYMLSEEAKRSYREEAQVTDSNTKMLNLMRNSKMFFIMMTRDLDTWRLIGDFLFKFLSDDAFRLCTFVIWLIGLAVNFVTAFGIVLDITDTANTVLIYRSDEYQLAVMILSLFIIIFSAIMLVIWLIFKFKQKFLTRMEDYLFDNPQTTKNMWNTLYVAVWSSFVQQSFPINYTLHILFTALGYKYSVIILSLNLLLIINISKTTKFVLTSIMKHIDQLALTLILALFVIFTYSVLNAYYFTQYWKPGIMSPCDTILNCMMFTMDFGLRNGGGVADSFVDPTSDQNEGQRAIFDISFFILINVTSLNIIFGIIIHTFKQLREEDNALGNILKTNSSQRHEEQLLRVWLHSARLEQGRS